MNSIRGLCVVTGRWFSVLSLMLPVAVAAADNPSLKTILEQVPPLKHDATGRLPMIPWTALVGEGSNTATNGKGQPLPVEMYRELAKRGLTQHIPLRPEYLPWAKAMQEAGAAVVFMDGECFSPYDQGADPPHRLPEGFKVVKGAGYAGRDVLPCVGVLDGWRLRAERVRNTLKVYKDAGVQVTGVWLDWEGEPHVSHEHWRQAAACSRCRAILPKSALDATDVYFRYVSGLRADLYSAYVAAPIREIYPACSILNWELFCSTRPCDDWDELCSATERPAKAGNVGDEAHMDRVYTHYMLEQISRHEEAAVATASFAQVVPWVCRFIPDPGGSDDVPLLSRGRYREILRHLWLRGADSMQIFNEPWPAGEGRARYRPEMAVEEVEDAVAVYDEMLAFREFMEKGVVMNTDIPAVTEDGPIWSGLRLEGALLIRAFTPGDKPALFSIKFSERPLELKALPKGVTYRITRKGNEPQIEQVTQEN